MMTDSPTLFDGQELAGVSGYLKEAHQGNGSGAGAPLTFARSIYANQDDILIAIHRLHAPEGFDADLTYGNGGFWTKMERPKYCFDLEPLAAHVVKADSTNLPLQPATLRNAVFDPPFLTYVKSGRDHNGGSMVMASRFGGYYTYDELLDHYQGTISECYRVLKPKGKLIFKCQDIVHNHRLHCTHYRVIMMAEAEGFRLADLFILPATFRLPANIAGKQQHARIFHSYFLVFERDTAKWSGSSAPLSDNHRI